MEPKRKKKSGLLLGFAAAAFLIALISLALCMLAVLCPESLQAIAWPMPTAAPTIVPAPAPTPTPEPTWQERFAEHFTPEVVRTEDRYSSPTLSVTLTRYEHTEAHPDIIYYVEDIYLTDIRQLQAVVASPGEDYFDPCTAAGNVGAVAAVNGDHLIDQLWGFVARNGEIISAAEPLMDICILYTDGRMETLPPYTYSAQAIVDTGEIWQVWQFGPLLLQEDGAPATRFNTDDNLRARHPRTALGYYEPGHYCFVVVDGRSAASIGVYLETLAQIMAELGCRVAYNLDGGSSTQMLFGGEYANQPCEDRFLNDLVIVRELEEPTE